MEKKKVFMPVKQVTLDDNEAIKITDQYGCVQLVKEKYLYVFTKEQLEVVIKEAFGAGSIYRSADITGKDTPTRGEYIESLNLE